MRGQPNVTHRSQHRARGNHSNFSTFMQHQGSCRYSGEGFLCTLMAVYKRRILLICNLAGSSGVGVFPHLQGLVVLSDISDGLGRHPNLCSVPVCMLARNMKLGC